MISARRCLIDTNVVVYAREGGDSGKPHMARQLMRACQQSGVGVLCTQVLLETFAVLTRRSPTDEGRESAAEHVGRLAVAFPVLPARAATVLFAADCSRRHGLRIFNAMLWATAMAEGVPVILTEDLTHGQALEGVTFLNPFADDFTVAQIGIQ
jgi:predicted nucleic acid-binding protein